MVIFDVAVVIVGAGPSGLATSACLNNLSVPNIILEREDCFASLWKKRTYDRLHLHLAKEFCSLPLCPHPLTSPDFIPREAFIEYLDAYVAKFKLSPRCFRSVTSAEWEEDRRKWVIEAGNSMTGEIERYIAEFLVVASGENNERYVPELPGLGSFGGGVVHSSQYKSGRVYHGKRVLVVGSGNSGMEVAYDLSNFGAQASIVIRSPIHVTSRGMIHLAMLLLKYMQEAKVDCVLKLLAKNCYGDLSKYGIETPTKGPLAIKTETGKTPILDVGTISKIKSGEIKVFPAIKSIGEKNVVFENGTEEEFDAIICATGYRCAVNKWLKDYKLILNDDGTPKNSFPNHWKGTKGLYCVGFSRRGLAGIKMDAIATAEDISVVYNNGEKEKMKDWICEGASLNN